MKSDDNATLQSEIQTRIAEMEASLLPQLQGGTAPKLMLHHYHRLLSAGLDDASACAQITRVNFLISLGQSRGMPLNQGMLEQMYEGLPVDTSDFIRQLTG